MAAPRIWLPHFLLRKAEWLIQKAAEFRMKGSALAEKLAIRCERQAQTLQRVANSRNERDMRRAYKNLRSARVPAATKLTAKS